MWKSLEIYGLRNNITCSDLEMLEVSMKYPSAHVQQIVGNKAVELLRQDQTGE